MRKSKVSIGKFIELRKEAGLTQKDLAASSGVSINVIKQIETGRSGTNLENFRAIADTFKVPISKIVKKYDEETKVINIINLKNRSTKTTVVQNLGYELAQKGFKILIIDADYKCGLSYLFGYDFNDEFNLYEALKKSTYQKPVDIKEYIRSTKYKNLDIIVNDFRFNLLNERIYHVAYKEFFFERIFKNIINNGSYDYVIFDCNSSGSLITSNILRISNYVIIPVVMTLDKVIGVEMLLENIKEIKVTNKNLELLRFLNCKKDERILDDKAIKYMKNIEKDYGISFLDISISNDEDVPKSQLKKMPLKPYLDKYKIYNRAREDFKSLAKKIIKIALSD